MIVALHFGVDADPAAVESFQAEAHAAITALGACRGFRRASVGRAADDPGAWLLVTEWAGVGAYRRALSAYDVKVHATPLLARARDEASAFEELLTLEAGADIARAGTDRAE